MQFTQEHQDDRRSALSTLETVRRESPESVEIEGVVIAPGSTGQGVAQFTKLPGLGIGLVVADPHSPIYIVYNDGTSYFRCNVPVTRALGG